MNLAVGWLVALMKFLRTIGETESSLSGGAWWGTLGSHSPSFHFLNQRGKDIDVIIRPRFNL